LFLNIYVVMRMSDLIHWEQFSIIRRRKTHRQEESIQYTKVADLRFGRVYKEKERLPKNYINE